MDDSHLFCIKAPTIEWFILLTVVGVVVLGRYTVTLSAAAAAVNINMKVYIAHTGRAFDVKIGSASDKVLDLKSALVQKSDISIHDQILLCEDGAKLDKALTIGQIPALAKPDAIVFLFNRQHLVAPPQPVKPLDPDTYDAKCKCSLVSGVTNVG